MKNKWGKTALHWAVLEGYLNIAKYLIEKGAKVDLQNKSGWTAMDIAKEQGNQEMIDLLTTKN